MEHFEDEKMDTGGRAVAIAVQAVRKILEEREAERLAKEKELLQVVQDVKTDVTHIKRMKEEERQEREGIWNTVKRVILAIVYEKGWAEKPGKVK